MQLRAFNRLCPSPLYVVNQGPEYTGPGLMVPYGTYAPAAAYAPGHQLSLCRSPLRLSWARHLPYGAYRGARFAYGAHAYIHPRYYGARPFIPLTFCGFSRQGSEKARFTRAFFF